jgi:modification methylase
MPTAARQLSLREDELQALLRRLPEQDNTSEALATLREANALLRESAWPGPFDSTRHRLRLGDARELEWLEDESVHLVVTSPPYWTLKEYNEHHAQLGAVEDYEAFLDELDRVWEHCARALVPGGRICVVVGDVSLARKAAGRHMVMPLHADIQVRVRRIGLDNLTPIHWYKVANGVTEAKGNGAGYYGKPYQPGAVVKNDVEYILFFRKGGTYRSALPLQKALSMLTRDEMQTWFRTVWSDVPGASTRDHPAPFPEQLSTRLIRMFSFAGDTVLDPFLGTGSTVVSAIETGRNSIGVEIDPDYLQMAERRIEERARKASERGPTIAEVAVDT